MERKSRRRMDEGKMIMRRNEDGMKWLTRHYNNENDDMLMNGDERHYY
jgi:hypothetical protein